jgi:outer membrane protein assembly factor BamD
LDTANFLSSTKRTFSMPQLHLPHFFLFLLLMGLLALGGCATTPDESDDSNQWSVEKLHNEGKRALDAGDYETAIEYFEKLEAKYPFGHYAEQAQLDTAYAYYKFGEYDSAIAAADRFIKLHPRHPAVDYAYYLRGLVSMHKKDSPFDTIVSYDGSLRDPKSSRQAYEYFAELVERFPQSQYAVDAYKDMGHLRNDLAKYELQVANYYLRRKAYVAAANRAKYIIKNFQQTPAMHNALEVLVEAYDQLGMDDLAKDARRVLARNQALPTRDLNNKEM